MISERYRKRFSSLMLDNKDIYLNKILAQITQDTRGMVYITSQSIIIEPFHNEQPIKQYFYQYMFKDPCQDPDFLDTIIFSTWSYKTLPDIVINQLPYIENLSNLVEISFKPLYESPNKIADFLQTCYNKAKSSNWAPKDIEVLEFLKSKNKFDYNSIVSITEKNLIRDAVFATKVMPYERIPGWVFVTDLRVYFSPLASLKKKPINVIHNNNVKSILKRKWVLRSVGIEIFTEKKSAFFAFASEKIRDEIFSVISAVVNIDSENEKTLEDMMAKWQQRQVSNYGYLLYLNSIANRTFCDYSQYPVFPWVLCNYTGDDIDLRDIKNYRDLSKPIGALNLERLGSLKSRLKDMPEPKFLYGTHYSNPSIIIRWLIRVFPLCALKMQGGRFDIADRIFHDVAIDWQSCTTLSTDFKELIPEFYGFDTTFLLNLKKLELGVRSNGDKISQVKLPNWAKSPADFLRIMRKALESDYVSENLHHWIDLIFGYKQRGEQAVASDNLFHHYTYEGGVDLDAISDVEYRKILETQIQEYGQTPKQLFKVPHAPRSYIPSIPEGISIPSPYWQAEVMAKKPSSLISNLQSHSKRVTFIHKLDTKIITSSYDGDLCISNKKISLHKPIETCAISNHGLLYAAVGESIISCLIPTGKITGSFKAHDDRITSIRWPTTDIVITGSWDYSIKLWDVRLKPKAVYSSQCKSEVNCVACGINNPYLAITGDFLGNITTYDFRMGKIHEINTGSCIFAIENTIDGVLICGTYSTDLYKNKNIVNYLPIGGIQSIATDGNFALVGKEEESLQLWHIGTGNCLFNWEEVANVTSVYCDGQDILAGSIEGIVYKIG